MSIFLKKIIRVKLLELIFIFVVILNFYSSGAIVNDDDMSAYVTKFEFAALKESIQKRIDEYNSINKISIDSAISNYLAGLDLITPDMEKVVHINNDESFEVYAGTNQLLGKSDAKLTWAGNDIITTENFKKAFIDSIFPVGSRYVQQLGMPEPTTFGGTWVIDTNYNAKVLWCDSKKELGTVITQSLPKPTFTFSGIKVTTSSGRHNHNFSYDEISTIDDGAGKHNHTFSGTKSSTGSTGNHTHSITTGKAWSEGNSPNRISYRDNGSQSFYTNEDGEHTHKVTAKGSVSSNGEHTHTFTPNISINNYNHSHTVTGDGSATCDTYGAYGDGSVVQPPAITCKVWKRTA